MLFLKRYLLPLIFALFLYSIVYLIANTNALFLNFGTGICLLYGLLLRVIDDFKDYEKDLNKGKKLFNLHTLKVLLVVILLLIILLCVFSRLYLMLIPLALHFALFVKNEKIGDFLKPFLVPSIIITLSISLFSFKLEILILSLICVVLDFILVIYRRKK